MAPDEGKSEREPFRDAVRRHLEGSKLSRSELEQLVSGLIGGDAESRERIEEFIEEFRARSRRSLDRVTDIVRSEIHKEVVSLSQNRRDELGEFFERLVNLVGDYFGPGRSARSTTRPDVVHVHEPLKAARASAKKALRPRKQSSTAKATSAAKAAVKKVAAKKSSAGEAAKKAARKRTAARKRPAGE